MSETELNLKEMNGNYKELFNFSGDEAQLNHLKETFIHLINNSNKDSNYLINFLNFYFKCRPNHYSISRVLIECVYSCFPQQTAEIQQYIKNLTSGFNFLKFIIFPEEFPIDERKEQEEIFLLLEKDDIDGFISFLSKNPTIDMTKIQSVERRGYYSH